ncbi:site-specific DNA-methyltransferase [Methylococcaceae bacterium CS5]|nr:site-specific DNA-methyltransferase [Methylococcaceae bacterium CS5]
MEKLKMKTPNITEQNMEQIAKLFPNVMTETQDEKGKVQKAIDFDLLKQSLSSVLVDDADERYCLDWPGKKAALLKANTPITKTLRPCREDSVNFDSTENVYIEGDNFEVLKILQESYLGKIKMIYIDPPYNTGKDFIYKDNFAAKKADYEEELSTTDEEDNKLFKNTDTNGRFHSDWLSMMYERLIVARDLLKEDGVIFISIDDNEVHNLRKICDEIFGEENFVANSIWQSRTSISDDHEISMNHNHTAIYAKNKNNLKFYGEKINESEYQNRDNDPRGPWKLVPLDANKPGGDTNYPILNTNNNKEYFPPEGRSWAINSKDFKKLFDDDRIAFGTNGKSAPKKKLFLLERLEKGDTKTPSSILLDAGTTKDGSNELNILFERKKVFSYPKPVDYLSRLIQYGIYSEKNQIILDFFSGSGTTAHSVMSLNALDGGGRKFIAIQLSENLDESLLKASDDAKSIIKNSIGFLDSIKKKHLLTEIGKERIRRAGKKIVEDNQDKAGIDKLDIGFRVYKTDSSNMKEVYYHPEHLKQDDLFSLESNIKKDRGPDDLLTQVILDLGLELNLPIEQKKMHGNNVFIVQTNALVACFDDNINIKIIDEIAQLKPFKVVFKDGSFSNSKDRLTLEERFKSLSPGTLITVI